MSGLSTALGLAAASAVGRLWRHCCCDIRAVVAFWSVVVVVVVAAAVVWSQLSRFFTRAYFVVIFYVCGISYGNCTYVGIAYVMRAF